MSIQGFADNSKWLLIHDGVNVMYKGQCGLVTTPDTIAAYTTEAELDAGIISLGLIDITDE